MRISTSQFQFESVNRMLEQQARLLQTQQQIASGKRIENPSDDPSGAARVIDVGQIVAVNEQYRRNADFVNTRLSLEESTITGFLNVYQRIRELTVQGLNDSLNQEDLNSIAKEVRQGIGQLKSLAETKDATGEYIFSGFSGNVVPVADDGNGTYTYQGDQGQRQVQVGPNNKVADGDNGFDVFFDIANTSENAFSAAYKIATALEADTLASTVLADIDAVMDNLNLTRSKTGARLNAIDIQNKINEDVVFQGDKLLSEIQDLDYAEAISRLNQQQVGLEAAQQSYVRVQGLSLFNFL